ncbi:MAG: hypothetical protein ACI9VT_002664, partial [Psychroserpens sp.]
SQALKPKVLAIARLSTSFFILSPHCLVFIFINLVIF